ncbi:hypothetical protein BK009_01075 [Methanobacterium subterraneum]|uniref:Uncharacterized protein n=1 Tax=Methanobacterium subterraneum TaxID=59277 RepID=A0A2H4VMW6_9EURY|nr:hypothetical protein BK009_01075 [Methanobacterium subterraneum]
MIQHKVFDCVNSNKSVLVYREDVHKFLPDLANRWTAIFVKDPVPPKQKLIDIAEKLGFAKRERLRRKTIEELKELIKEKTKNKKIVILFNHFERTTQLAADTWGFLINLDSIVIVASYSKNFKAAAYTLFRQMEHIREEMHEEIDIKYSIFAIITVLGLFSYIKLATANNAYIASMLLAGIWFGLIVFRTFIFVGRG